MADETPYLADPPDLSEGWRPAKSECLVRLLVLHQDDLFRYHATEGPSSHIAAWLPWVR